MDLICRIWHNRYPHLRPYKQYEKCDRCRKVDVLHMGWAISLCRCQGQLEGQGQGNSTPVIMITSPGDPEDSQWWTVMRKRKRISSAGRRCTVGRKRGSREAMQWKKWARWRGGNRRQTERNKHEMVKRNKDREREPTRNEKGRALRSVYMDRCTRSQDIGVNPKQLSWRNLQHIHTAGEEQEQPRVSPWISCRAHKWGEGWAVPWSTVCRVTPHSGCPGGKLPLSDLGIGQKQTLAWNNMET